MDCSWDFLNISNITTITLKEKADITDPCYNRDTWCRINDIPVKPGDYICNAKRVFIDGAYLDEENVIHYPEEYSDSRIAEISIIQKDYKGTLDWEFIENIGVDAGLAGFFRSPYSPPDDWHGFCNKLEEVDKLHSYEDCLHGIYGSGGVNCFFSSSGFGDGGYSVYGVKDGDKYVGLRIVFIDDIEP